ncbi:hypothetical protein Tco_0415891, partial [Tanacetum coccineum]
IDGLGLGFEATSGSGIRFWTTEGWTCAVLSNLYFAPCPLSPRFHVPLPSGEEKELVELKFYLKQHHFGCLKDHLKVQLELDNLELENSFDFDFDCIGFDYFAHSVD